MTFAKLLSLAAASSVLVNLAFGATIPQGDTDGLLVRRQNSDSPPGDNTEDNSVPPPVIVITNFTVDRQPVPVELDIEGSLAPFIAALVAEDEDYDGDLVAAATKLVRHDGCDNWEKDYIYRGWVQSWKLMNKIIEEIEDMNFNEASAVEFLGPPAMNKDSQERLKGLYKRWATIRPGLFETPFDWRLHVRCDDPRKKCGDPCNKDLSKRGPYAYTTNNDTDSKLARINFCPRYFTAMDLGDAIKEGKRDLMGPEWMYNVQTYMMNKAHVWAHELMHVNWAVNAGKFGKNRRPADLRMKARKTDGTPWVFKAYGSGPVKALARYHDPIRYRVMENADSLALYASVRYIQSQLDDVYPHLPLAPAAPDTIWDPNNPESDSAGTLSDAQAHLGGWELFNNGTVGLPPVSPFRSGERDCPGWEASEKTYIRSENDVYDEDGEYDPYYTFDFDSFVSGGDLGENYKDQLDEWYEDQSWPVDQIPELKGVSTG